MGQRRCQAEELAGSKGPFSTSLPNFDSASPAPPHPPPRSGTGDSRHRPGARERLCSKTDVLVAGGGPGRVTGGDAVGLAGRSGVWGPWMEAGA